MCRILALGANEPFDCNPWISAFAERCHESKEYQGHGWGVAWRTEDGWAHARSLIPIWEDERVTVPLSDLVLVHARSAFQNEGIEVQNNMPFVKEKLAFAFNGELHGVRLNVPGETGAARLCHLLDRFRARNGGDIEQALATLDDVITRRASYVRAMNIVASDERDLFVHSRFGEDPEYFTMQQARVPTIGGGLRVVASEPFSVEGRTPRWYPIPNNTTLRVGREVAC